MFVFLLDKQLFGCYIHKRTIVPNKCLNLFGAGKQRCGGRNK